MGHTVCDQKFFTELMKEATDIAGCFSSRVRQLLQLHIHGGSQRYFTFLSYCFVNSQQKTAQECRMLTEYAMMNAVAMRKILKKYDKVCSDWNFQIHNHTNSVLLLYILHQLNELMQIHSSANGSKFKSKMRAQHMEILQSPWLIELGAFFKNFIEPSGENCGGLHNPFSFDLTASSGPTMTLILPDNVKLEYNLTCAICLVRFFLLN